MRIDEFASAEEQLALWKLISNNVWGAIAAQAEQERRASAEKAARTRPKRGKRSSSPKALKPITPKPPAPEKPTADTGTLDQGKKTAVQKSANAATAQKSDPLGASRLQPRAPIKPIPPVTSSISTPQVPQPSASKPKPRITARAGGLTYDNNHQI